jgi:hypothetical protein
MVQEPRTSAWLGIAVALAAKSTLENFMGALNLFADRPVGLGDLCRYDPDQSGGWRAVSTVESIGLRSTKIRKRDRSLLTIPNAEFAQRDILNLSACDRFLLTATLGLRYQTTDDQLRFLLGELRELLQAHPKTIHFAGDPLRVRFVEFGDYSLNVAIRAYMQDIELQRAPRHPGGHPPAHHEDRPRRGNRLCLPLPHPLPWGLTAGSTMSCRRKRSGRCGNEPRRRPCRFRTCRKTIASGSRTRSTTFPRVRPEPV